MSPVALRGAGGPVSIWARGREEAPAAVPAPLEPAALLPGHRDWEVEIGFGKGRYLLAQAARRPDTGFLGIEVAAEYYRRVRDRAARRGIDNLALLRGQAEYLLATGLPVRFASAVHVYFPDPWPKSRHQRRRLFDAETVDLVIDLLRPGGSLWFATDFLSYGAEVAELLAAHPGISTPRHLPAWPEGPRTGYEAKYEREGRPILRLTCDRLAEAATLHPQGRLGVVCAWRVEAG